MPRTPAADRPRVPVPVARPAWRVGDAHADDDDDDDDDAAAAVRSRCYRTHLT
jgi:hypothetical protein